MAKVNPVCLEIWNKIQNLEEEDLRWIETRLSEMRRDESRANFAELRRRYLRRKNKFGRFEN